jgi:hypothetical protein
MKYGKITMIKLLPAQMLLKVVEQREINSTFNIFIKMLLEQVMIKIIKSSSSH